MSEIKSSIERQDTFPKILLRNAETMAERPAYRMKHYGIWQPTSWQEAAEIAKEIALGLADLGAVRGDKIALIGYNKPEMYISFDAIEGLGMIPVPLYADSVAEEMSYVLDLSLIHI